MPLKALEIKAFSRSDKPYRKPDGQGMYLEVRPNGSKLWFLKYRIDGKEKRLGLGSFPEVGLVDARTARDKPRAAIQTGRDPLHDRKMTKIERRVSSNEARGDPETSLRNSQHVAFGASAERTDQRHLLI